MACLEEVIIRPIITEKASVGSEKFNRYGFRVEVSINKNQIKKAVERLYNVKVLSIATNIRPGKIKRAGRSVKKTGKQKRAYVTLGSGQKIEFFKGI